MWLGFLLRVSRGENQSVGWALFLSGACGASSKFTWLWQSLVPCGARTEVLVSVCALSWGALSFQRLLLRNSPARYHTVAARSRRPVFSLRSLWDSLPQNPGPNATSSELPCEVIPIPQERLVRTPPGATASFKQAWCCSQGPSSSWPPYPALWQAEGWQRLSPHVYSTLTQGDKAALMCLSWSCQGGQHSDGYHRTPSCPLL